MLQSKHVLRTTLPIRGRRCVVGGRRGGAVTVHNPGGGVLLLLRLLHGQLLLFRCSWSLVLMGGRLLPGQVLLPFSQPGLLLLLTLLFLIPSITGRSYSGEVDQLID